MLIIYLNINYKQEMMMEPQTNLIALIPNELMLSIFKFLPPKDLCNLSGVSRKIKTLAEDDQIWKAHAKREYPNSSKEFDQREIVDLNQQNAHSSASWKAFYRQRTAFYSAACNHTLAARPYVTNSSIACLDVFQNTVYAVEIQKNIFVCSSETEVTTYQNCHPNLISCIKVEKNKEGNIRIYNGSMHGVVKIWEESFQLLAELTGHEDLVWAIETNENHLFSASKDKTIRIWDKTTYQHLGTLNDLPEQFRSMTYGADKIIAGTLEGSIGVWDGLSFDFLKSIKTKGPVYQVKIWENKIYCADNFNIQIFDLTNYELIRKIENFKNSNYFDIYDGRFFYCSESGPAIGIDLHIYNAITFERQSKTPIRNHSRSISRIRVVSKGIFYTQQFTHPGLYHYPFPSLSD